MALDRLVLNQQVQLVVLLRIQLGVHQLPLLLAQRILLVLEHFIELINLLNKSRINPLLLLLFLFFSDHEWRRNKFLATHDGNILKFVQFAEKFVCLYMHILVLVFDSVQIAASLHVATAVCRELVSEEHLVARELVIAVHWLLKGCRDGTIPWLPHVGMTHDADNCAYASHFIFGFDQNKLTN